MRLGGLPKASFLFLPPFLQVHPVEDVTSQDGCAIIIIKGIMVGD